MATYSVGARLSSITFDGVNLWGTFEQNAQAVEISTSTGSILNTYSTGTQPKASVFDGHNLWTANSFGASITEIPVR